jgi:hypothetical protein
MGSELLARVRWNNVGIVALAAGVLVLVVAWPLLGAREVVVPAGTADVVARSGSRVAAEPPAARVFSGRVVGRRARASRGRVRVRVRRAGRQDRRRVVRPRVVAPPVVVAPPRAAVAAPAPEFAFER